MKADDVAEPEYNATIRRFTDGLLNDTLTTCSRWSSKRRVMGGDFGGFYSTKYHPWVKEMMDSKASFNYAMKAAQMGVTEGGVNRAFYVIDKLKRDVLYVLPNSIVASDFSRARFGIALKYSPYLESIFTDTNAVNIKQTDFCTLYIRGSKGDSNLISIPVSELILDEVDRMDQAQVALALERLSGQLRKSVFGMSTPTIPGVRIHRLYKTGTQEHFMFQCPRCSLNGKPKWTELIWPDCVEIIGDSVHDPRCHESYLKCKECKGKIKHLDKPNFLATAKWESTCDNPNWDVRSWYINQLYSYTITPGELVVAYHRGLGDEAAEKEFFNSKLGLPFVGLGGQITDEQVDAAIHDYRNGKDTPKSGKRSLITLGMDQGKWNHWVVCQWFVDEPGFDINVSAFCKVLAFGKFGGENWEIADELMKEWQVLACVVDAQPEVNEARRFARRFPGFVWLCRYPVGKKPKEIAIQDDDSGAPEANVDRSHWMTASLGRFKKKRIAIPRDVTTDFREQIKSPVRSWERDEYNNPVMIYEDTGPDHYAHALTYSEIALPMAASISTGQPVERFL